MKQHSQRTRGLLTSLFALGALSTTALAHVVGAGTWPSYPQTISASAVSFPPGTPFANALGDIEAFFISENPSNMYYTLIYGDPLIGMNNGQNETWFTANSSVTSTAVAMSWISGSDLVEVDVIYFNGLSWTLSANKTSTLGYGGPSRPFRATTIHEWGHVGGLAHEADEYNVMGQAWDHIWSNGSTYGTYLGEDAANGLISIYGTYSGNIEDVGASVFKWSGSSGAYSTHDFCILADTAGNALPSTLLNGQPRFDVAPGQQVQVEFSLENNGASFQSVEVSYLLSEDNVIDGGDELLATRNVGLGRNNVLNTPRTVTIPRDLDVDGTYYLGVRVDSQNVVSERNEDNNYAYHAFRVVCDVAPTTSSFNYAPNPDSLTVTPFQTGNGYTLTVDLSTSGHDFAQPFAFDTIANVVLSGGQRLLCIDGGSGNLLPFPFQAGPTASFGGTVPNLGSMCGLSFSAQAIHFGGVVPFALSNVQDCVIGN